MKNILIKGMLVLSGLCGYMAQAQQSPTLEERFKNPPMEYRMNLNTHDVPHDAAQQKELLDRYQAAGYGGLATNVNWTDDYMQNAGELETFYRFVRSANERGMNVWLYDEKIYPAGMAGTMILDAHPEWEAEGLFFRDTVIRGPAAVSLPRLRGEPVRTAAVPVEGENPRIDRAVDLAGAVGSENVAWKVPAGEWHIVQVTRDALYEGFQAGNSRLGVAPRYPSLLMPEVTEMFIDVTHQKYAEFAGEKLGNLFTATFTDEPSLMAMSYTDQGFGVYPWKQNVSEEFRKRSGCVLEEVLLSLLLDEGSAGQRLRYIYFEIVSDFMSRHFFRSVQEFCHTQDLLSGGHLLVEETLMAQVPLYGNIMACFRKMDVPGIDVLTGMPSFTRRYLYSSRLASSAAELEGNRYVMTEICPIADPMFHDGREAPTADVRGTINRQMVGGVNRFNNYLQLHHGDAAGRERFNTYVGRVTSFLTGGVRAGKIAVYYPIETMWTKFRPLPMGLINWDQLAGGAPQAQALDGLFDRVSDALMESQWEFSYVDAQALEQASVEDGALKNGELSWQVLILPGVETLSEAVARQIDRFIASGGTVIALEGLPVNSTTAFPSKPIQEWVEQTGRTGRMGKNVFYWPEWSAEKLNRQLEGTVNRALRLDDSQNVLIAHRKIDGENRYFITNDSDSPRTFTLTFTGTGEAEQWEPQTGEIRTVGKTVRFQLEEYGGMLFRQKE